MARGNWVDPTSDGSGVTFEDWAQRWLAGRVKIAPRTRRGYEALLRNHINPFFGRQRISDIKRDTVQRFVGGLVTAGVKPGTVRNAHAVVSSVLRHAVHDGRLSRNPATGIELPEIEHEEVVPLTPREVEALADAIATKPGFRGRPDELHPEWALLVRFAAYTGLRASEIVGLRVGRVDLARATVHVRETTFKAGGRFYERQPTKNRRHRVVQMPRSLANDLAAYVGDRADKPDTYVFPAADGRPMDEVWWYSNIFKPAVRRAGLPDRVRFHDLRHTYASLLIEQGEPLLVVSRLMGHSTTKVTEATYGHLYPTRLDAAADRLDTTYRHHASQPSVDAEVREIRPAVTA